MPPIVESVVQEEDSVLIEPTPRPVLCVAALTALAAGCTANSRAADREAARILAGEGRAVAAARDAALVFPRPAGPGEEEGPVGDGRDPPVPVPEVMTLDDALRIATRANREYRGRAEALTLAALSLSGERFRFSPRLAAAISYLVADGKGTERADSPGATASASQVLPTGGTLTVSGSESGTDARAPGGPYDSATSVEAALRQPLLRGAGWEASHESLTQAQRAVVYALRDFARYREQFLIDVTRRYYDVVSKRFFLRNAEDRHAAVEFQARRTQALFEIGSQDKIEVFRAEADLRRVDIDLKDARDGLSLAEDQFKVFLGLPTTVRFAYAGDPPPFRPVDVSLASAVEAALANRFDLANAREQVEDAERALRIARRNLLPDLALEASWRGDSGASRGFLHSPRDAESSSVGLFLEVPLQQTLERNALRSAEIALDRQRRDYERSRDDVVVEVRDTLNRLRHAASSLLVDQPEILRLEEGRLEKARLDFEAGRIGNRDVLEAQQALQGARDQTVRRAVDYEIARLGLERAMGTLEVGDDGRGRGLRTPPAAAAGTTGKEEGP